MEKCNRELLFKIKVGDYIKCHYTIFSMREYTEGFVTYITSISYILDNNCTIYFININEIEITHADLDLGL